VYRGISTTQSTPGHGSQLGAFTRYDVITDHAYRRPRCYKLAKYD